MPPKKPGSAKPPAAPVPQEDELLARFFEQEALAVSAAAKAERLSVRAEALSAENWRLGAELTGAQTEFSGLTTYLRGELLARTQRVEALEAELKDVHARLAAAEEQRQREAAAAAAAAQAAGRAAAAELQRLQGRLGDAEQFLSERDVLQAQLGTLQAAAEQQTQAHHKKIMDLERKHTSDRELWRKETAAAVQAAREDMASATDQRLDATTKRTIVENEQMSGELTFQAHQVQRLLGRNSALQKEVGTLRVELGVSRGVEQELARRNCDCEATVQTLLARLEALDAARSTDAASAAEVQQQVQELEGELHRAAQQLGEQETRAQKLQAQLSAKTAEMRAVKGSYDDVASFLLACTRDARQELLAAEGSAALAAAAEGRAQAALDLECLAAVAGATPLHQLPLAQREALLRRLLQKLHTEWEDKEGLILPSSSSSALLGNSHRPAVATAAAAREQGLPCSPPKAEQCAAGPAQQEQQLCPPGSSSAAAQQRSG